MIHFLYPNGKKRVLTFSYDDGVIQDRRLVELLNRYNLRGTFHLNAGKLNQEGFLTSQELPDLFQGHEISAHSLDHPFLNQLCQSDLVYQLQEDRRKLEEYSGKLVRGMSYPFGIYSDEIIETAKNLGLEYSRTVENSLSFRIPEDFLKWHPTCHHKQLNEELIHKFLHTPSHRNLYLLYVWGHSYEFDNDQNWEEMEENCAKLAHIEDVWYATNIEVKDYIQAMKSMIVSVDQTMIYNPSATSVWIRTETGSHEILAGETFYVKN